MTTLLAFISWTYLIHVNDYEGWFLLTYVTGLFFLYLTSGVFHDHDNSIDFQSAVEGVMLDIFYTMFLRLTALDLST